MHPIHKHMSSRMGGRKADEKYDAKEAYNKDLSGKARLHYLENDIHDKGMSMKSPMEMKSPTRVGPHAKSAKKKEYSFGEKALGTVKNIGNYAAAGASKILNAGSGYSKGGGSQPMDRGGIAAQAKSDTSRARGFQESHLSSARKRRKEGSAFFMESEGQEKKDLMKYNPIDDRAGSPAELSRKQKLPLGMNKEQLGRSIRTAEGKETKRDKRRNKRDTKRTMRHVRKHGSGLIMDNTKKKTSPVNMASPMYDKGHEGDQDGHVHPRTQGEVDVMNKHGQALNKFIGKVNKFGNMSESQMSRVNDKINSLQGQYNKTRDSIGNVHKQFDLKRDQEFEDLFGDGK